MYFVYSTGQDSRIIVGMELIQYPQYIWKFRTALRAHKKLNEHKSIAKTYFPSALLSFFYGLCRKAMEGTGGIR